MKRIPTIGLIMVFVAFLTVAVLYAFANKAQETPQSQKEKVTASVASAAAPKSEKQQHAEGSTAWQAKHASGECTGHEPGQPHQGTNGQAREDYAEGSAACKA